MSEELDSLLLTRDFFPGGQNDLASDSYATNHVYIGNTPYE